MEEGREIRIKGIEAALALTKKKRGKESEPWYAGKEGQKFPLDKIYEKSYSVKVDGTYKSVIKGDGEIV